VIAREELQRVPALDLMDLDIGDLDLDLVVPPSRSARAAPLVHEFDGVITPEDVALLVENPSRGSETNALVTLKTRHHKLAQLLAEGIPDIEASLITGYTQTRISILKNDPAFKELLAHYRGVQKEVFINVHERLAGLSMDALEELHQRLEDKPESFTIKQLQDLIPLGFDRSGFGPKSTQGFDIHLTTDSLLSSVKDEIRKKSNGRIETLGAQPRLPRTPQSDSGSDLELEIDLSSLEYTSISGTGSEGGGQEIRKVGGEETPPPGAEILSFPGGNL